MTNQWDRFADSAGRETTQLGFQNNLEVFEPTEAYTQGDGWDVSYPDTATDTLSGETAPPSSDRHVDTGGTTQTADMHIYVPSDAGYAWTDTGQSGEAVTQIHVVSTDTWYEVDTVDPMFDGSDRLRCSEVNK